MVYNWGGKPAYKTKPVEDCFSTKMQRTVHYSDDCLDNLIMTIQMAD